MMRRAGRSLLHAGAYAWLSLSAASVAEAQNRQPISTSLVECAAIFGELATVGELRGRDASDVSQARDAAARFSEAALVQARNEGQRDPKAHLTPIHVEKERNWDGRFANPLKLSDNKDWIDYCRSLGRDRGLLK